MAGFLGYSRCFLLWAAAQRERLAASDKERSVPILPGAPGRKKEIVIRLHTVGLIVMLALGLLMAPLAAEAQQPAKVYRLGFLDPGAPTVFERQAHVLEELGRLGYVAGHNLLVERRNAVQPEELAALAAELVARQVDLMLTGGTPATQAAQPATATIPIIFFLGGDPVQSGLIASYARPGGNVTGFVIGVYTNKLLEILKEVIPGIARIACPYSRACLRESGVVRALGLEIQDLDALALQELTMEKPEDFERFIAAARRAGANAVLIPDVTGNQSHLPWLGELTVRNGLPAISHHRRFAEGGGLLSYGSKWEEGPSRLAAQVDKILKGVKVGDIPVEQHRTFELVINLKTAKALGITIAPSLLLLADEVIQ